MALIETVLRRGPLALAALAAAAVGCSDYSGARLDGYPAAVIDTPAGVQRFISFDVDDVHRSVQSLLRTAEQTTATTCPMVSVEGDTRVVRGGCTDAEGTTYAGTARVTTTDSGARTSVVLDGFTATQRATACADGTMMAGASSALRGTVRIERRGASSEHYELDAVVDGQSVDRMRCVATPVTMALRYSGDVTRTGDDRDGDGRPDRETWNGTGRAGTSEFGAATIQTIDEVLDRGACAHEPLSGTLRITAGTHRAEVLFDGASRCDEPGTATWTFDGAPRGDIRVGCAVGRVAGARGAGCGVAAALTAVAIALGTRRRARRRRAH